MNNADVFEQVFGIYATEMWAMKEEDFLKWLNSEHVPQREGRWIDGKCNRCGTHAPYWAMASTYYLSEYCPHCGADMREGES